MKPFCVFERVYQVGGSAITSPYDCSIYLVDCQPDLVLIDSGGGASIDRLLRCIGEVGLDPDRLVALVTTHAHSDHVCGHAPLRERFGLTVICHELDANTVERGLHAPPCPIDVRLQGEESSLTFGEQELKFLHIPGHTPGSIVCYVDMAGKRVLFGQDIHGPYYPEWGADPVVARASLQKIIGLNADILCEGHFGIYQPAVEVRRYIERYRDLL